MKTEGEEKNRRTLQTEEHSDAHENPHVDAHGLALKICTHPQT